MTERSREYWIKDLAPCSMAVAKAMFFNATGYHLKRRSDKERNAYGEERFKEFVRFAWKCDLFEYGLIQDGRGMPWDSWPDCDDAQGWGIAFVTFMAYVLRFPLPPMVGYVDHHTSTAYHASNWIIVRRRVKDGWHLVLIWWEPQTNCFHDSREEADVCAIGEAGF